MATVADLYKKGQMLQVLGGEGLFAKMYVPDFDPRPTVRYYDTMLARCRDYYNDMLVPEIVRVCGHFNSLFDEVDSFRDAIEIWSKTRAGVWNDLVRTTIQSYDLISNYDRTEQIVERRINAEVGNSSADSNATTSGTNNVNNNGNVETSVSAYNSPEYTPRDKVTNTASDTVTSNGTNTGSASSKFRKDGEEEIERTMKVFGNVGVTTAQQMLEEERRLVKFNIVDHVVQEFKNEFCILVY